MKKILKLSILGLIGLSLFTTTLSANPEKGKKLYIKKLKGSCNMSGTKFAQKHTQDEWENIFQANKFKEEVLKICPNVKLKKKYSNDIYDFAYEYASDSGNVPSC